MGLWTGLSPVRVAAVLAPQHPGWRTRLPFKAVLDNDLAAPVP